MSDALSKVFQDLVEQNNHMRVMLDAWPHRLANEVAQARADALEEAARVCNETALKTNPPRKAFEGYEDGYTDAANDCTAAIRALIEKKGE